MAFARHSLVKKFLFMKILTLLFTCLLALPLQSQLSAQDQKYWIFFADKDLTGYDYRQHLSAEAIANRQLLGLPLVQATDAPVNAMYLQALRQKGVQPQVVSHWLNAATAWLAPQQLQQVKALPFVAGWQKCQGKIRPARHGEKPGAFPGMALSQMNVGMLAEQGLTGEGVNVGVIDAGFYNAHKTRHLNHLFEQKKVLGYLDFVNPRRETFFEERETFSDWHGTNVLKMITGMLKDKEQLGLATGASFYLARTDHGVNETRSEEDNWVRALEWMDSLGVRLVNTSLGYSTGFDNPEEDYAPGQMDGQTSVVTRAAQIAAREKGMLLVVSAGNEGNLRSWQVVSAPADAQDVFSVGATDVNGLKAGYSSTGPEELQWLKPNVSCYSPNGTSFSAPVITGLAACLLQKKPDATASELFLAIEQSASLYPLGNNYIGQGIPDASKALQILAESEAGEQRWASIKAGKNRKVKISLKKAGGKVIVFHKTSEKHVKEQDIFRLEEPEIHLVRPGGVVRSTVLANGELFEVYW